MIFILEVAFLLGGLYAIVAGRIPSFMFGGPHYEVVGLSARLLGVLLTLPLPGAFAAAIVLIILFGQETGQAYGAVFEVGFTILVAIIALVVVYIVRKPKMATDAQGNMVEAVSATEEQIARKVNGSIIYLILGGLGFAGFILAPLAAWRTHQAIKMIEEQHVGEGHLGKAKIIRVVGLLLGVFWFLACFGGGAFLLLSSQ